MNSPIMTLAIFNMVIITVLLIIKSVHYFFTRSEGSFETYLYSDIRQAIATSHPKVVAQKRFQNFMSALLVVFILIQLLFCILYILIA